MEDRRRLTLAELKAKADQTNVIKNLEAIKGAAGELSDCHTDWGRICKAFARWAQ